VTIFCSECAERPITVIDGLLCDWCAAVHRGRALADEHCRRGLRDLEATLPRAREYVIDRTESGTKWQHPERAMLAGMADYLRASMKRAGVL
jgi:hypothetical protein